MIESLLNGYIGLRKKVSVISPRRPAALHALIARGALGQGHGRAYAGQGEGSYGRILPTPDYYDGVERLALPAGFSYTTFGMAGTVMSDGNLTPLGHAGMSAFALPNGNIRLIRSHADCNGPGLGSLGCNPWQKYDPLAGGGAVSLEINPVTRQLTQHFASLSGTLANYGTGFTPWNSGLICERAAAGTLAGWDKPHGYIFELPAVIEETAQAKPLRAMGRFNHGNVAVYPISGSVYETEASRERSGFYRFTPQEPGNLVAGGRLQMLAIKTKSNMDMTKGQRRFTAQPVTWVDIDEPDPPEAAVKSHAVFEQGYMEGGANFGPLEDCFYCDGSIIFSSLRGGRAGLGQVWSYRPLGGSDGVLRLLFESHGPDMLESPTNIHLTPREGVLLSEGGDGQRYLRGLTSWGRIFDFAFNLVNDSPWSGITFSPDGQILFANIQGTVHGPNPPIPSEAGMTFAIWGRWENGEL